MLSKLFLQLQVVVLSNGLSIHVELTVLTFKFLRDSLDLLYTGVDLTITSITLNKFRLTLASHADILYIA